MSLHKSLAALLCAIALAGCEKNAVRDLTAPIPAARVKFFNFAVSAPPVHFYAGDAKVTATFIATCSLAKNPPVTATDSLCLTAGVQATTGVNYAASAAGGLYTGVEAGQYTFASRLAADGATTVSSATATIEAGKAYSYYQSGIYNTATKSADAFIVEDNFGSTIDWTVTQVRFVNATSNAAPVTISAINVETAQVVPIGTAVAYKSASPFVSMSPGTYNLQVRFAGSNTDQILLTNAPFEPGRVYTLALRGDMTVTLATSPSRPTLEFTLNR